VIGTRAVRRALVAGRRAWRLIVGARRDERPRRPNRKRGEGALTMRADGGEEGGAEERRHSLQHRLSGIDHPVRLDDAHASTCPAAVLPNDHEHAEVADGFAFTHAVHDARPFMVKRYVTPPPAVSGPLDRSLRAARRSRSLPTARGAGCLPTDRSAL